MKKNRISIGVTSYNQVEYVEETIISLLAQNEKPFEIVVSDNHSTDGSFDVLKKYSDKIKLIQPKSHLSYTEHVEFLVKQLSGDWFLLAASDDVYLPNLVGLAKKHVRSNAALLRYDYYLMNKNSEVFGKVAYSKSRRMCLDFPHNLIENVCQNRVPIWATFFNKSVFEKVGGFDKHIKCDQDWALILKMSEFGSFLYRRYRVCNYRHNYRETQEVDRLMYELDDTAYITNSVIKGLFVKHKLSLNLWKQVLLMNCWNKLQLFKKYGKDTQRVFDTFGIDTNEMINFSKIKRLILNIRTTYLNR